METSAWYITRNALTEGIIEVKVKEEDFLIHKGETFINCLVFDERFCFQIGKDIFPNKKKAEIQAKILAEKSIRTLENKIVK